MTLFVVIMYRYADEESHSYLLGVYDDRDRAVEEGDNESMNRARKYYPHILSVQLNDTKIRTVILDCGDAMDNRDWDKIIRSKP